MSAPVPVPLTIWDQFDMTEAAGVWTAGLAGTWNHHARTVEKIPASTDGWVELKPGASGQAFLGLMRVDKYGNYSVAEYGIYATGGIIFSITDGGTGVSTGVSFASGDFFRLGRTGNVVTAYRVRDGVPVAVSSFLTPHSLSLYVVTALLATGDSFSDLRGVYVVNKWEYLRNAVVACLGNSKTRGYGSTANANGYPVQMQAHFVAMDLDVEVHNAGQDSAGGAILNASAVTTVDPYYDPTRLCVLLYSEVENDQYAANDLTNAITQSKTCLNNRNAGWVKCWFDFSDRGLDSALSTTPGGQTRSAYRTSLATLRSNIAADAGSPTPSAAYYFTVMDYEALIDCTVLTYYLPDETHHNDLGYTRMMMRLMQFLSNLGTARVGPPLINTFSLPAARLEEAYNFSIAVNGGEPPLVFSLLAGALPEGLTLNPATGAITGTPTSSATASFAIRVTAANDLADQQAYSLEVLPPRPSPKTLRIIRLVYVILGRPSQQKLPYKDVEALLGTAAKEVVKAVAGNPAHSYFSSLMELVEVENGAFLPQHEGEPGVPLIVPFPGAEPRSGIPADPDEIDSYMYDLNTGPYRAIYSGAVDQHAVAYNQPTALGRPSPTACRYSFVNGQFKFTGESAQVPLVQLDETTGAEAVELVPGAYEPTLLRLVLSWCGQPWDKFYPICLRMAAEANRDLAMIRSGKVVVPEISPTVLAQKAS